MGLWKVREVSTNRAMSHVMSDMAREKALEGPCSLHE